MSRMPSPYFILLKDKIAPSQGRTALVNRPEAKPRQVLRGTLLEEARDARGRPHTSVITGPGGEKLKFRSLDHDSVRVECSHDEVARLSRDEKELLQALVTLRERYDLFNDRTRLDLGLMIKTDSMVYVDVPTLVHKAPGKVRYKGPLPGLPGTQFGVELLNDRGQGTTDGTFRKQRLFQCEQDCGVFVTLQKLSDTDKAASQIKGRGAGRVKKEDDEEEIVEGMRVVIFCDEDGEERLEHGTVKYIGKPKKLKGETFVGIELDNPAGSGNGKFDGEKLFVAKKDHATLVPIGAVLPYQYLHDKKDADPVHRPQPTPGTGSQSELVRRGFVDSNKEPDRKQHQHPYATRSKPEAKSTEPMPKPLSGTAIDVLDDQSKELGMSRGDLLKEQEELMRQFAQSREKESKVAVAKPTKHLSDSMRMEDRAEDSSQRLPADAHRQEGLRNSVFYTDGDNVDDVAETPKSRFYVPMTNRAKDGDDDYEHMSPQPHDYENVPHRNEHKHFVYENTKPNNSKLEVPDQRKPPLKRDYSDDSPKLLPPGYFETHRTHELGDLSPDIHPGTGYHHIRRSYSNSYAPETDKIQVQRPVSPGASAQMKGVDLKTTDSSDMMNKEGHRTSFHRTLSIGTMVEILGSPPRYGVIRWIGMLPNASKEAVGVELEEELAGCTDGTFQKTRYFKCPERRAIFVLADKVRPDSRFAVHKPTRRRNPSEAFGKYDSPLIDDYCAPPDELSPELCGAGRGIQGHHNSCYLDTTLYSMFAFSLAFDDLILRQSGEEDLEGFEEVQGILKRGIVNPLRKHGFVRADRVLKFRELLDQLGSLSGLTTEEKDPEEFLNTLLKQIFKAEPYLKLRDVQGEEHSSYFYQMFMDKDESTPVPTVQQLFEQSFIVSDMKLVEVPRCLLLQMPRFGKAYKMYDKIIPSLRLDITDVLEEFPRQCTICQFLAEYECRDCNVTKSFTEQITAYCEKCVILTHSHQKRKHHKYTKIHLDPSLKSYFKENPTEVAREYLELFAVVCIETSHYVAFVRCGRGEDKQWCFFDSMSDRQGEEDGHNIPAVTHLPEFVKWLEDDKIKKTDNKDMPEHLRRLVCDAYLLFYQSPDALMYG